ncbi:MAG: type II toxin-antitoxin system PemK/MazF family toxin [Phycisphaerae bacterium]
MSRPAPRPLRRGEVRWYRFARPDRERPVLILTRDSALQFLGEATIAPLTTTVRDIPSEVVLTPADGLPRECAVNLDHVQTVSVGKIGRLIATLGPARMQAVRAALLFALAMER